MQNEIIGCAADRVAEHIPDIGHFIKCVSNGFYKLKEKNKEFSGVGLLDVSRIKAVSADVSRHLREYNIVRKSISNSNESHELKKDNTKVGRNTCLSRIDLIIYHHCDNHEFCDRHHYKYKSIDFVTNLKLM